MNQTQCTSEACGPLTAFTFLVAGDSRAARFVVDLLAGLGARLVSTPTSPADAVHSLLDPAAGAAMASAGRLDAIFVLGERDRVTAAGLGREECLRRHPAAVYASAEAAGPSISTVVRGRTELTTDPFVAAECGLLLGFSDPGQPRPLELPIPDIATALTLVLGVSAALSSGDGAARSTSVATSVVCATPIMAIDAMTQSMVDGQDVSRTSRHRWAQIYVARCAGGSGLTVHLSSSDSFWRKFVRAIGREDLLGDPRCATYHDRVRHYDEILRSVSETVGRRSVDAWEPILEAADVPFAPVLAPMEALTLPQVRALGLTDENTVPEGAALVHPLRFDGRRVTGRPGTCRS